MGFEELLGNERLKENLMAGLHRGRISHFYLICGPEGSGKKTLARLLSAAILCAGDRKPCGGCSACRKVFADTHPDLITVEDPEHKTVPVKMVRDVREDMFIRPNEAAKKIYRFPQELGIEGQNALLKILEEPPEYGVYILLSDNAEKLLPTVRSRCVELRLQALPQELLMQKLRQERPDAPEQTLCAAAQRSGGWLGQALALLQEDLSNSPQAEGFARSFGRRDAVGLAQVLVPMQKWKRDALVEELIRWQQILHEALLQRSGVRSVQPLVRDIGMDRSAAELKRAVEHLQQALIYARQNVSPAAVCGWLEQVLR